MSRFLAPLPLAAAGLWVALTATTRAQDTPLSPRPASEWIVTLGGMVGLGTKSMGESRVRPFGLPWISIRRAGEPAGFWSPDDGLDFALFDTGSFSAGPLVDLRAGRQPSVQQKIAGIGTVPGTVEAGAFAEFWPVADQLRLRAEIRQGLFNANRGRTLDLGMDWLTRLNNVTYAIGPRAGFGDDVYMRDYFGLRPTFFPAIVPGTPRAGLKNIGLMGSATLDLDASASTTVFLRGDRLVGSAASSPLIRLGGSRTSWFGGLAFARSFGL